MINKYNKRVTIDKVEMVFGNCRRKRANEMLRKTNDNIKLRSERLGFGSVDNNKMKWILKRGKAQVKRGKKLRIGDRRQCWRVRDK